MWVRRLRRPRPERKAPNHTQYRDAQLIESVRTKFLGCYGVVRCSDQHLDAPYVLRLLQQPKDRAPDGLHYQSIGTSPRQSHRCDTMLRFGCNIH